MPTSDGEPSDSQPSDSKPSDGKPSDLELTNGQRFLRFLESTPNIVGCIAGLLTVAALVLVAPPGPIGFSAVAGVYLVGVLVTWLLLRRTRGPGREDTPPAKPRRAAPG